MVVVKQIQNISANSLSTKAKMALRSAIGGVSDAFTPGYQVQALVA